MPRPVRPAPRTHSLEWPEVECRDQVAEIARLFAIELRAVAAEVGLRELSRRTGITHTVLGRIINGDTWADTHTLARLEVALDRPLWPRYPTTSRD